MLQVYVLIKNTTILAFMENGANDHPTIVETFEFVLKKKIVYLLVFTNYSYYLN